MKRTCIIAMMSVLMSTYTLAQKPKDQCRQIGQELSRKSLGTFLEEDHALVEIEGKNLEGVFSIQKRMEARQFEKTRVTQCVQAKYKFQREVCEEKANDSGQVEKVCRQEDQIAHYKKIVTGDEHRFIKNVPVNVNIEVTNAPMAVGELLRLYLKYDGQLSAQIQLGGGNEFAPIEISRADSSSIAFDLGLRGIKRLKVNPPNNLESILNLEDNGDHIILDFYLGDRDPDPAYGDISKVEVEVIARKSFAGKKLVHKEVFELEDGNLSEQITISKSLYKKRKKFLIKYRIQRIGSDFYNEEFSYFLKSDVVKIEK
jgi:hypothetical protein